MNLDETASLKCGMLEDYNGLPSATVGHADLEIQDREDNARNEVSLVQVATAVNHLGRQQLANELLVASAADFAATPAHEIVLINFDEICVKNDAWQPLRQEASLILSCEDGHYFTTATENGEIHESDALNDTKSTMSGSQNNLATFYEGTAMPENLDMSKEIEVCVEGKQESDLNGECSRKLEVTNSVIADDEHLTTGIAFDGIVSQNEGEHFGQKFRCYSFS